LPGASDDKRNQDPRATWLARERRIFERSMGLDLVPEPLRTAALDAHEAPREVVLGYRDELIRSDAEQLQARIEQIAGRSLLDGHLAAVGRCRARALLGLPSRPAE
jgi:hypothetical protein